MSMETDDYVLVEKPKFTFQDAISNTSSYKRYTACHAIYRYSTKGYKVYSALSTMLCRLTWIHCSMAPWCSPKVAFCASVIVLATFVVQAKNLRR
jgi:hypothetical protein